MELTALYRINLPLTLYPCLSMSRIKAFLFDRNEYILAKYAC